MPMKPFNLQAGPPVTHSIGRIYAAVISVIIILLSLCTYYMLYKKPAPAVFSVSVPAKSTERSALYHYIKIFEHLPRTAKLTSISITPAHIILEISPTKTEITLLLQQLASEYTIIATKQQQDGTVSIELSPSNMRK